MWEDLMAATALLLVFEGILPFLNPRGWRRTVFSIASLRDRDLRLAGAVSMLLGVGLLYLVR